MILIRRNLHCGELCVGLQHSTHRDNAASSDVIRSGESADGLQIRGLNEPCCTAYALSNLGLIWADRREFVRIQGCASGFGISSKLTIPHFMPSRRWPV